MLNPLIPYFLKVEWKADFLTDLNENLKPFGA